MANTDDARTVAHRGPQVEARLAPERQRADLVVLGRQLDALDALGAATFAVVARARAGWPAAIAFVDGLDAVRRFVARFHATGTPTIWPAGAIIRVDVFGLDLSNPETVIATADQPRGRWLLAGPGDALVDPTTRPRAVSGTGRAARRRGETP